MKYDGILDIATGMRVDTKPGHWKNQTIQWSALVKKLTSEHKTNETFKEFIMATRDEQSKIKDVGGFVGGYVKDGIRKPANILHRQLVTLDIDFAYLDFWEDFILQYGNAAVLHATHKHCSASPRYRLIMPLSRKCSPEEYVAVSRQIAGSMGIDMFDNTTFETHRLMFWPSSPKDVDYYVKVQDGPWIDVDETLGAYTDWRDSSSWPTAVRRLDELKKNVKKQEDPELKRGLVGAFCRAYPIEDAIEELLSEDYEPTNEPGRYTYVKGSTKGGLVTYEGKFAFSHHGTSPSTGKLCNSWDLVRIHKFGELDEDDGPTGVKAKSYKAMEDFARANTRVKIQVATERVEGAKFEFAEDVEEPEEILTEEDIEWMKDLEMDRSKNYLSTANNINLILANDARFRGLFKQNDFDGKRYVFGNLPWRRVSKPDVIRNVDYSGVRNYIEVVYGITGSLKIDDSLALEFERNHYHPIREYLEALEWDGVERIETLLIDYFGAEDNIYVREAIQVMMTAAVARVFQPGIKYDLVLTLVGPQGTGKSTFVKKLGKAWFSDTFLTVQGKEALEQILGAWIIEIAELAGFRKAESESIKHFVSKQEDTFRPAYARTSETYPRQCIFVGTTNSKEFLRDPSGNRRFMPIDINISQAKKSVFTDLDGEIDQLWAEAVQLFHNRTKLYLSPEAEAIAYNEQKKHAESDERRGLIEEFLDTPLPEDWDSRDVYQRRNFYTDPLEKPGTVERDCVPVAAIWCELFGKSKEDMDRYKTREINDIMRSLDNWEQSKSTKNFALYGKQKYYSRKLD